MSEQHVIEDPVVLKQRLSFRRTTGDDGEDVLLSRCGSIRAEA